MPNERMVRSWISPVVGIHRQPFGEHPAQRHVRGADRVRAQHDVVERITGGDAHLDTGRRDRASSTVHPGARQRTARRRRRRCRAAPRAARASATSVERDRPRPRRSAPSSSTARSARPDRTQVADDVGGPGTVTARPARRCSSSCVRPHDRRAERRRGRPPRRPRSRDGRRRSERRRRDRRPLGPEPHDVFAREHDPHRRDRSGRRARGAAAATGDDTLPPNAPPLASGFAGSPPGSHHDASGSR